ncbi:MAG: SDR family oxidoreductase [Chitinophagaceae bacterium]|nr:SDR family oxidoreductase [Chitinophagaceae bacterium]MCW5926047.1 SDR family oxidoreductase [Chitinophagaceae bacterium]
MLLKDKVFFLTGGSSGIGLECAKAYIREGAILAIASNNEKELNRLAQELDKLRYIPLYCDVSSETDAQNAIQKTLDSFGKLDAIHNNAGIVTPSAMLHETTTEEWHRLMDVNLKSIYLTTKYGLEALRKTGGSILNTSSLAGHIGQEMHAVYTATKGGISALTKSMALDYAKYRIRVNAVCPAWVKTPAVQSWVEDQEDSQSAEAYINSIHPLGYCPGGDVIADVCVFLLSDKARFITGCTMPVSGGAELGYRR